jgi:hypothetical protein
MYIKEHPEILNHPNTRVQYIRKRERSIMGNNNNPIFYSEGAKRGVLISFLHPEDRSICIGYSLMKNGDKWDHIDNIKVPKFGKNLAISKGLKFHLLIATGSAGGKISIPKSIHKQFISFLEGSAKYYKDKPLPWIFANLC